MSDKLFQVIEFIKSLYPGEEPVPLHAPRFTGNEKKYLAECIDSTFVSYVGEFVNGLEKHIQEYTGVKHAVAMVNGTSALQIALMVAGVKPGEEVITQALTFVATANAIKHAGAEPVFVDVDRDTIGMSHEKLDYFLKNNTTMKNDGCYNKTTGSKIGACVPMHTFGHMVKIDKIIEICNAYNIRVVEDSAEALGSFYRGQHAGTFGVAGILSFNGNKPVTTGGGGMLITNDAELAEKAKHLSTTAKQKHAWAFIHDEVGFNLRMPNINAAVGCAQMEKIDFIIDNKRQLADIYKDYFDDMDIQFVNEPVNSHSNYWLNAIVLDTVEKRNEFLKYANDNGVQARPVWTLMNKLLMYSNCNTGDLSNSEWLEERIVNIPSSVRVNVINKGYNK